MRQCYTGMQLYHEPVLEVSVVSLSMGNPYAEDVPNSVP